MQILNVRRSLLLFFLCVFAVSPVLAYPVAISINATFVTIAGDPDPLQLGTSGVTATITTTLESVANPGAGVTAGGPYPATVILNVPGVLTNLTSTGTVSINTNGTLLASFSGTAGSFTATVVLPAGTFPEPIPLSFGTKSFSSPASTITYDLAGAIGTVGINGTISATGLLATPSSISAAYTVDGTAPASQTISVSSNGPAFAYAASIGNASASFLTLGAPSGTTPGSVTLNFSTAVAPGTYTANVLINTTADNSGAPLSIPVTYTVLAGGTTGTFSILPSTLSFQFATPSSTSYSLPITISVPSGTPSFTASVTSGAFLSVSPTSGSAPGTVTVTADAAGLATGSYTGSVLISVSGFPAATIPVTVTISNGSSTGSTLAVSPTTLTFDISPGASAAPQIVKLTSPTPVSFSISGAQFYLPVSPLSGTTPAMISIGVNGSGLTTNGTYADTLIITAGGSTVNLPVTVNVGPIDNIALNTYALTFTAATPTAIPPAQTITIDSSTATQFSYSLTTSAPWITVTPSSGTSPGSFTVTANPTGLAAGTTSGTVTVTAAGTHNSPQTIRVSINVPASTTPPVLSATPGSAAFAYQTGGTAPAAQTIQLGTSTAGTAYTVTPIGDSWLTATVAADNSSATLAVNASGLLPGVYNGAVLVAGSGISNSPYTVPVTLTVSAGPVIGASPGTLSFGAQASGAAPASQTLAVSSTVAGDTVSVTSDSAWLTVTPASVTAPGTVTVSAAPGALAAGTYTGHLTLTGAGTSPAGGTVMVTFNVGTAVTPVLNAVVSAISYATGPNAPGSLVALFGSNLGPATGVPLQLVGATVTDSIGGTVVYASGIPCPILYTSAGQVNAILPFALDGQTSTSVSVTVDGVASNVVTVPLQASAPALFSATANGSGPGAILNQDLSLNTQSNPAAANSVIVLYGGGAGESTSPSADGQIVPLTAPFPAPIASISVTVGGVPATIQYAGAAPGLVAGVLQVNALLGAGTPSGAQPVVVTAGGVSSQSGLTVFVQ